MKTLLEAEWKTGDNCEWIWQRPTRVDGFEVEEPAGAELVEIIVGLEPQLVGGSISLIDLVQWWPKGVPASPDPGWKIGRIALPAQQPGSVLRVHLLRFRGRLRPFGVQVP